MLCITQAYRAASNCAYLDHPDPILSGLVVDELEVAEHLGALFAGVEEEDGQELELIGHLGEQLSVDVLDGVFLHLGEGADDLWFMLVTLIQMMILLIVMIIMMMIMMIIVIMMVNFDHQNDIKKHDVPGREAR